MASFRRCTSTLVLLAVIAGISARGTQAQTVADAFDPANIISDAEMRRTDAMSLKEISDFLAKKGGLARQFDIDPADGEIKDGAKLVYDAAHRYEVNPKYVLALLQKESSIVETPVPTSRQLEWAAGYALCDGCYRDAPLPQKYRGLAKQIDAGAGWMDWYMDNAAMLSGYRQPGAPTVISGETVVPANLATAALYNYTPHLHGNRLLWDILQRWFGKQSGDMKYPDGTLVRNARTGAVALIQGGRFRPILKKSVLQTRFRSLNAVDLSSEAFAKLEQGKRGAPVRFPDLSLVSTEAGDTFLLVGSVKRRISSPEAFASIGFNPEEVEEATEMDLEEYAEGEPIESEESFPLGQLVQDPKTGGVWFAEAGTKRPLLDKVLLAANFPGQRIVRGTAEALSALKTGDPVLLADGALVKAAKEPSVYLISHGEKRPFAAESDFKGLGFKFTNVKTVSKKFLDLHPTGSPIKLESPATR